MNAEILIATIVLAACAVMLARLAIGARRRDRLDAAWRRTTRRLSQSARSLWHRRRLHGQAEREADDLIERARRGRADTKREGNVYRPRSFNGGGDDDSTPPDGRERRDH